MSAIAQEQLMAVAFVCDKAGTVSQVIYDGLEISAAVSSARTFIELVDQNSAEKARAFLDLVGQQGAAFGWELNVAIESEIKLLHFAGCVVDDGLLITAATSRSGLGKISERLVSTRRLPVLQRVVDSSSYSQQLADVDSDRYDELALMNNELITLQRELVKRTIELENSNEQKNEFIGMAAHDLRNPLQVIDGYSRLLLCEAFGPLTTQQREMVAAVSRNSDFMLRLITDLLQISRIEAGKLQLDVQPADIVDLVRKNVQLNRLLAQQKEIELRLSCEEEELTLLIDSYKIEQVLNNLLQNAIKFSYPRTVVTVGLNRTDEGVVISVQDQGQGIPAKEMDRLFKPFQKMTVRSTGGEPSTGLGLAIAKRIVVGHHGEIRAESTLGTGSTFYVRLPFRE
jgi:signal transduction histidine kinase